MKKYEKVISAVGGISAVALCACIGAVSFVYFDSAKAQERIEVTDYDASKQPSGKTVADKLLTLNYIEEAVQFTRPYMYDRFEEMDAGSYMLSVWALYHQLGFLQVAVKKNQTDLTMMIYDVAGQRGKRFCTSGMVTQVEYDPTVAKLSRGLFISHDFGTIAFISMPPKAEEISYRRWCGVFTGHYEYTMPSGVLGVAIKSVGTFEPKGESL